MEMKCTGNCIQCEWREDKSVDDVLFCQNAQTVAKCKQNAAAIIELDANIAMLLEAVNKVVETAAPRKLSDFPELTDSE